MPAEIKHRCTKTKEFSRIALNNKDMASDIKEIKDWQIRMEDTIKEIKESGAKRDSKIDEFIKEIREWYVTVKAHEEVKTQLEKFKDKLWNINAYVLTAFIWSVILFFFKK